MSDTAVNDKVHLRSDAYFIALESVASELNFLGAVCGLLPVAFKFVVWDTEAWFYTLIDAGKAQGNNNAIRFVREFSELYHLIVPMAAIVTMLVLEYPRKVCNDRDRKSKFPYARDHSWPMIPGGQTKILAGLISSAVTFLLPHSHLSSACFLISSLLYMWTGVHVAPPPPSDDASKPARGGGRSIKTQGLKIGESVVDTHKYLTTSGDTVVPRGNAPRQPMANSSPLTQNKKQSSKFGRGKGMNTAPAGARGPPPAVPGRRDQNVDASRFSGKSQAMMRNSNLMQSLMINKGQTGQGGQGGRR